MARNVLRGAHSYTLIKPNNQKVVVRRGQTIDNLDEADQQYLATKSITPPAVDDSHPPLGAMPVFVPVVDADVKGEASVEDITPARAPSQPYAGAAEEEDISIRVDVSGSTSDQEGDADDDADASDTSDGAAAGGSDDGGGTAAEAPPAKKSTTKRRAPARRKPAAKKKS